MEGIENGKKLINEIYRHSVSVFAIVIAITSLVFAKMPEYRPTIYSERTVVASTSYQPSLSRDVKVDVPVSVACALSLSGGTTGQFNFQTSPDNSTWTTKTTFGCANTGSLTIGLNITNTNIGSLNWTVQKGNYYRITTTTSTGAPTYTITGVAGEEQL